MSRKINAKLIVELQANGNSYREIIKTAKVSNRTVTDTIKRFKESSLTIEDIKAMSKEEVYQALYPDRYVDQDMYYLENYEYVHKELLKAGVTLKLLWQEYLSKVPSDKVAASYSKYCEDYGRYVDTNDYVSHLEHRPGDKIEVDWSGKTMSYIDQYTGEEVKVYLFVAALPYSRYSYVEPTLDMTMKSWINCNVHMFNYIGGVTRRIVCDNLKTGVTSHPKEGEIVLNETYEALGEHYIVAIMPAGVKKPRHKSSAEGTVGNIATEVIAKLRNYKFTNFESLKKEVRKKLDEYNNEPFQKREGSRKESFENEEKASLRPLPIAPFELADWVRGRKVMNNCHISFQKNFYSVPYQYVGKYVDIKVKETTIEIYYGNKRLTSHIKLNEAVTNKYSTHIEDMPESIKVTEWDDVRIKAWAAKKGPNILEVINRIFDSVKIKEQAYNPALSVLKIAKKYGDDRLEKACGIALNHYRSPRYKHIIAILANNQDIIEERKETNRPLSKYSRGPEYYGGKKK